MDNRYVRRTSSARERAELGTDERQGLVSHPSVTAWMACPAAPRARPEVCDLGAPHYPDGGMVRGS